MITLNGAGVLSATPRFDNGPIAERIDQIEYIIGSGNRREAEYILEAESEPAIAAALSRLMSRSRPPSPIVE